MPVPSQSRSDLLLSLAAAAMPGGAAAWSATRLAPLWDWPSVVASPVAGCAAFVVGIGVMRAASRPRPAALPGFSFSAEPANSPELLLETLWEDALAGDDVLLLDGPVEARVDELAELMLDDPLPVPGQESRVVQLFAARPNAGELVGRIERHLGRSAPATPGVQPDAADSLRRALDELRRSLRQA